MLKTKKKSLEERMYYTFKNKDLLTEALTHKSYCVDVNRHKPYNERLEFLGDSILNFVIADDLYKKFPNDDEGYLSKKRASLVNQVTLNQLALNCGLAEEMIMGPGERRQNSHLKPRILASCFEAVIGAIYFDSNFEKATEFILHHFTDLNFKLDDESGYEKDYKTRLQEVTQKFKMGTPIYELVMTAGPSHKPSFLVCLKLNDEEKTRAEGATKKMAEQMAAQIYLNILNKELNLKLSLNAGTEKV
ncbi:MAG: ribonuclease III [Bdellovibrio sp.]|nr:ribonuclease III [Bdellovibrio sp.]